MKELIDKIKEFWLEYKDVMEEVAVDLEVLLHLAKQAEYKIAIQLIKDICPTATEDLRDVQQMDQEYFDSKIGEPRS